MTKYFDKPEVTEHDDWITYTRYKYRDLDNYFIIAVGHVEYSKKISKTWYWLNAKNISKHKWVKLFKNEIRELERLKKLEMI